MDKMFGGKPITPVPSSFRVKVLGTRLAGSGRTEIFFVMRWEKDDKLFPVLPELLEQKLGSPCTFLSRRGKTRDSMTIMWSRTIMLRRGGMWNYINIQQHRINEAIMATQDRLWEIETANMSEMEYYIALDERIRAAS